MRKSKIIRRVLASLLCLILVATFGACTSGGGDTQTGQTSGTAASGSSGSETVAGNSGGDEEKVLEYASLYTEGESYAKWFKEMGTEFEKETGIKVNFIFSGRDVLTKMKSRFIMNDPPDLIDQKFTELSAALLKDQILIQPLTDFLYNSPGPEDQKSLMDIFFEDSLKIFAKDGEMYFYPLKINTSGFFYDKAMFKANGFTPPKTWDEFLKLCDDMKAKGITPLVQDGNINYYNVYYYYWLSARQLGSGKFFEAASDKTGAAWDNPDFLKVAQMVYNLGKGGKNYFQNGYEGSVWPAGQVDWAQGHEGMILMGTWVIVETQPEAKDDFDYGYFPVPAIDGGKGALTDNEISFIGAAIPKEAKHPENAKKFLLFLSKQENAQKYVEMTVSLPGRRGVDYPVQLADVKASMDASTQFHTDYDGCLADLPEWLANVFYSVDNKLFFGQITPEEFIKELKKASIDYWAAKK